MIKTLSAAVFATTLLSFGAVAQADEFSAAPMNAGPPTLGAVGTAFPPAGVMMTVVNGVTQPIVQPILAPAPAAAPEPMMKHHHHHHRMMMHKKMMKKAM